MRELPPRRLRTHKPGRLTTGIVAGVAFGSLALSACNNGISQEISAAATPVSASENESMKLKTTPGILFQEHKETHLKTPDPHHNTLIISEDKSFGATVSFYDSPGMISPLVTRSDLVSVVAKITDIDSGTQYEDLPLNRVSTINERGEIQSGFRGNASYLSELSKGRSFRISFEEVFASGKIVTVNFNADRETSSNTLPFAA